MIVPIENARINCGNLNFSDPAIKHIKSEEKTGTNDQIKIYQKPDGLFKRAVIFAVVFGFFSKN